MLAFSFLFYLKKLDAIEKLKEQQTQGKALEVNQIAKIKGEADLIKELEHLQM
jgi:translation initiation factor 2A